MEKTTMPETHVLIYTPDNEPYLGRELLFHFDQLIVSLIEDNSAISVRSRQIALTDHQKMACILIPQSISIVLSIRELIRQGYLFSAHVLKRAFVERVIIIQYLDEFPSEIKIWNNGWLYNEAPSLSKMMEALQRVMYGEVRFCGKDITASMNSLLHGKPDSAPWNMIVKDGEFRNAVSKIINRPDLCDDLCADMKSWTVVVQCMMKKYFSEDASECKHQ